MRGPPSNGCPQCGQKQISPEIWQACPQCGHWNGLLPLPWLVGDDREEESLLVLLVVRHGRSSGLLQKLIMGAVEALADKLIRKSTVLTKLHEKYEKISFMMFLNCGKMSWRHCWLADSSCDKKYPASSSSVWLLTVHQGKEVLSASD